LSSGPHTADCERPGAIGNHRCRRHCSRMARSALRRSRAGTCPTPGFRLDHSSLGRKRAKADELFGFQSRSEHSWPVRTLIFVMQNGSVAFVKGRLVVPEALPDSTIESALSPDDAAFTEFFTTQFGPVSAYCARLLPAAEAQDTAQEALVRVWTRWRTVRDPRAYAFVVATNLVRRYWRAETTRRSEPDGLESAERSHAPGQLEQGSELRDLVERLPIRLRTPTLLHYYADLPTAEVARLMRRPEGTIRRRLSEARRLLGDSLTEAS
jgi:RNA polymerase sigma-70 factor (ECF subfamily)